MAENRDTRNTLGDADLGYLEGDVASGDLGRGFYDAAPRGNYEGSLEPPVPVYDFETGRVEERHEGTLHAGQIEPDGFVRNHGDMDQYGFVRRPYWKTDVERN